MEQFRSYEEANAFNAGYLAGARSHSGKAPSIPSFPTAELEAFWHKGVQAGQVELNSASLVAREVQSI